MASTVDFIDYSSDVRIGVRCRTGSGSLSVPDAYAASHGPPCHKNPASLQIAASSRMSVVELGKSASRTRKSARRCYASPLIMRRIWTGAGDVGRSGYTVTI